MSQCPNSSNDRSASRIANMCNECTLLWAFCCVSVWVMNIEGTFILRIAHATMTCQGGVAFAASDVTVKAYYSMTDECFVRHRSGIQYVSSFVTADIIENNKES